MWLIALSIIAVWQAIEIHSWPKSWLTLVEYAPYAIMVIGGFISLWLNRIQPFLVLFSIFLVNLLFFYFAPSEQVSIAQSVLFPVVSLLLPLNIFLWSLLPEKGVHHRQYNGFVAAAFLLQALFFYWLMTELPLAWVASIAQPVFPGSKLYHLTFASTLAFLIAGFVLSMKLNSLRQLRIFNHSVVFILLLMAFALNQYHQLGVMAWVSSIAGLIIILSLVFDAHHIAYTDELTGLKGRRALNESFMSLGKRYAIAMVDIDHFKQFNDTYGHDVGDQVLKMVAATLDTVSGGKAYRFGGEEFTLIFKNKSIDSIIHELERLRVDIAKEVVYVQVEDATNTAKRGKAKPAVKEVSVTISLGLAVPDKKHTTPEQVLKFADEGLYKAKRAGRNKLVVAKDAEKPARKPRGKKPPIVKD
ncbi:GGDEF domain-containing protein [Thiomicrorhabdus sp.]|uniref:GGDEF domain-containing protein n=1 Tax=Thiomicrorhabdus sp. TaxID=2039724 RepID=UPI002AA85904|nr:GGDEF domain-containing protein [Thiomicrorhabdus sp.]